jgi:hypothetical protein
MRSTGYKMARPEEDQYDVPHGRMDERWNVDYADARWVLLVIVIIKLSKK